MKNLMIIESPGKIKTLKTILGSEWDVKATVGHIRKLDDAGRSQIGFNNNYEPLYINDPSKLSVIKNLKTNLDQYQRIVLATDPDREGEGIAWHVQQILPKAITHKLERVTFNAITKKDVLDALANPRHLDLNLVNASIARALGDKTIGYEGSAAVRNVTNGALRSSGRVQGVANHLIIEREKLIQNYQEEWRHRYNTKVPDDTGKMVALKHIDSNGKALSYQNKAELPLVGKELQNIEISRSELKYDNPPKPLITSSALKKGIALGLKAGVVSSSLQSLYDKGLISYIRTDNPNLAPPFVPVLLDYVAKHYQNQRSAVLKYNAKKGAQEAHEAIRVKHLELIPEAENQTFNSLSVAEQKMYREIYKNTLIQGMKSAEYYDVTFKFRDEYNNYFATSSKSYSNLGYKQYLGITNEAIYQFTEEQVYPAEIAPETYIANPKPSRYTEATMIEELERLQIGRPSTYATYPTILKKIGAVTDGERSTLVPTDLAFAFAEANDFILSELINPSYTGQVFEPELDAIAQGSKSYQHFIAALAQKTGESLTKSAAAKGAIKIKLNETQKVLSMCPTCKQPERDLVTAKSGAQYFKCDNVGSYDPKTKQWSGPCAIEFLKSNSKPKTTKGAIKSAKRPKLKK